MTNNFNHEETEQSAQLAEMVKKGLSECLEKGEDGRLRMTIAILYESVLENMTKSLAQILGQGLKQ